MKEEDHVEIYGELREELGLKTYLHGPMDYAKTLELRFRAGDPDLPERRRRYTSSRGEEEEGAQIWPCGKAAESRIHMVGECKKCIQGGTGCVRGGDMRKIDECGMKKFGTQDSSEKTIAILGDIRWPQTAKTRRG